jgi:hypothetical protein
VKDPVLGIDSRYVNSVLANPKLKRRLRERRILEKLGYICPGCLCEVKRSTFNFTTYRCNSCSRSLTDYCSECGERLFANTCINCYLKREEEIYNEHRWKDWN